MRHGFAFRRLGRDRVRRQILLKSLATALIKHERIVTTLAKAKELRRVGDWVCATDGRAWLVCVSNIYPSVWCALCYR